MCFPTCTALPFPNKKEKNLKNRKTKKIYRSAEDQQKKEIIPKLQKNQIIFQNSEKRKNIRKTQSMQQGQAVLYQECYSGLFVQFWPSRPLQFDSKEGGVTKSPALLIIWPSTDSPQICTTLLLTYKCEEHVRDCKNTLLGVDCAACMYDLLGVESVACLHATHTFLNTHNNL